MQNKTGRECAEAYERLLNKSGRHCWRLASDSGKEYLNEHFAKLLKKNGIEHRIPKNHDVKCALAESSVKRLKTRIYRYLTEKNTLRYVDVLDEIVESLNHMPLASLGGICSADVNVKNAEVVWQRLYGHEKELEAKHKYQIGQKVRLAKEKSVFTKGYKNTFTVEIFLIKKRLFKDPPAYIIEDLNGEEIDSVVYETELVAYNKTDDVYKIEKILRTRKRKGKVEHLVRLVFLLYTFDCLLGGMVTDLPSTPGLTTKVSIDSAMQQHDETCSTNKHWTCGELHFSRALLVFLSQVALIYIVVGFAIFNLSFSSRKDDDKLWVAVLASCIGYLLPSPNLRPSSHFQ